jgi:hypothetical protein
VQQRRNLIAVDDGSRRRQAPAAARAGQDIDCEDPREQACPADPPRPTRSIVFGGRRRVSAVVIEQSELSRSRRRRHARRSDGASKMMAIGEQSGVADHVKGGRRDQGNELGDELVRRHGNGAAAS